jgi:HlyD family secretion protein
LNQAKAGYESSLASKTTATANLEKAEADLQAQQGIVRPQTAFGIGLHRVQSRPRRGQAQVESADDQVNVAKAAVDSAQDSLDKTTIVSPLDGTITN